MANSPEHKGGGYNTHQFLADRGFERMGCYPNVTVVAIKIVKDDIVRFRFIRVIPKIESSEGKEPKTVFRPSHKTLKELRGLQCYVAHVNEGILDNITGEGIIQRVPPMEPVESHSSQAHPRIIFSKGMKEISDIINT